MSTEGNVLNMSSINIDSYKTIVKSNETFAYDELKTEKPKKLKELWMRSRETINSTLAGMNATYEREQNFEKIDISTSLETLHLELTKLQMIRKVTKEQLGSFVEKKLFCGFKTSDCRFYGLLAVETLSFLAGLAGVGFSESKALSTPLFVATYALSKINECLNKKQLIDEKQKAILREIKGKFSEIGSIENWIRTIEVSRKTMEAHFKEQHKTPPGQRKNLGEKSFWDVLRNATVQMTIGKKREDGHASYISVEETTQEPPMQEFYCNLAKEVQRRDSSSNSENEEIKSEEGEYVFNE